MESGERWLGNRIAYVPPTQHFEAGAPHECHAALDLLPKYLDRSHDPLFTPGGKTEQIRSADRACGCPESDGFEHVGTAAYTSVED